MSLIFYDYYFQLLLFTIIIFKIVKFIKCLFVFEFFLNNATLTV